ncbi:hypothetical protein FQR65_LT14290 [Abscondita terminalis]|nr:hypothetical protein FQR65_LT14290 [Abscondita terminalis]
MGLFSLYQIRFGLRYLSKLSVMKYLNVAEKNDAAKNIAKFLSRGQSNRREGLSNYNKIYEFEATVFGQRAQMVMTSVSGHLLNYEFVSIYRNWQSCNPMSLFDAPVVKHCAANYENIKKTLEREIRQCQGLIIWTDCDREGENIGFEIIKVCTDVKPNVSVYRAKFSEITGPSIFRALNTLGQPNKNISDAVDVRQELDLRTGAAFTRLQTLRLQKVFPQKLADKLISYGSCQFPTLGFVVERYKAIEEFIAEPFWKIKMNHAMKSLTVDFTWKRDRLFNKNACEALLDMCKENAQATVENVDNKAKNKWRPLPLDTVELEKNVSRKLRINAKDTMKIAEKLYTQGYISYPRTETNIFPKELNLTPLVEQQYENDQWGGFARNIITNGGPNPRQGRKSDQAHPPIHPTKYVSNLTGNEQRIYEYIVRHFLACVSKDAVGHETTVDVDIAGEKFFAKGLLILERNYLEVYIYEKWNVKEIHEYRVGDYFIPTELALVESHTTPPKLLTEADLITLMEKHGIGTDATHADHIDTIKSREYVGLHENMYFVPGVLGMGLVEGYNSIGLEVSLAKPNLRADFEKDLKLICEGLKNPETVRREQIENYRAVFRIVMEKILEIDRSLGKRLEDQPQQLEENNVPEEFKPVLKCPRCNHDMVIRNRKNGSGKYLSCTNFPNCKNAAWLPIAVESAEVLNQSCSHCGPDIKMLRMKFKHNLFPGEPNPNVLCIGGCDMSVLDTLNIKPTSVRTVVTPSLPQVNSSIITNVNINAGTTIGTTQRDTSQYKNRNTHTHGRSFLNATATGLLPVPHSTSSIANGNKSATCNCNVEPVLLTVRKEGPNTGRQFYKCQSGTCNYFSWVTDETPSTNLSSLKCDCNLDAVERKVVKDGPNKGRSFFCCPKPLGEGCRFFKWSDEVIGNSTHQGNDDDNGGGSGILSQSWNSRNSNWKKNSKSKKKSTLKTYIPGSSNSNARRPKKCSICKQEGAGTYELDVPISSISFVHKQL